MLTNRERGDRFDLWVLAQMEPYVTNLRTTIGSGSVFGDQDQVCEEFRVSCKLRNGRGLTLGEVREPYNCEAINVMRCPLTVLRVIVERENDEFEWQDYALVDIPRMLHIYGKDALVLTMGDMDFEVLRQWPAGLSMGLLGNVQQGKFLIVHNFPEGNTCSFVLTFVDYMNVLAYLHELRFNQSASLADLKAEA
jgi:hypothetical protein